MTLLSETTEGMHNLFRLSSRASMEGYYFKPRMDRELLQTYGKGLIATTGCPGGEVQTRLRLGQYDAARAAAAEFQDIFGKENYFAEIMDHGLADRAAGHERPPQDRQGSRHPARRHERPALHAPARRRQPRRAAVRAVRLDARRPEAVQVRRRRLLRQDAAEMRQIFRDHPEACDNTLLIAERCDVEFNTGANYMPRYPGARRRDRESRGSSRRSRTGCRRATPAASPTRCARGELRDRRHRADGVPGLLPRRRRLHQLGQATTASASDPAAVPAPDRWRPTRCGSPTSTRSSTA